MLASMVLTLVVGWLVLSVLLAALWSLAVRRGLARNVAHGEAPDVAVGANHLVSVPSPRRTQEGMAEFRE